jgi:hypothetical protein
MFPARSPSQRREANMGSASPDSSATRHYGAPLVEASPRFNCATQCAKREGRRPLTTSVLKGTKWLGGCAVADRAQRLHSGRHPGMPQLAAGFGRWEPHPRPLPARGEGSRLHPRPLSPWGGEKGERTARHAAVCRSMPQVARRSGRGELRQGGTEGTTPGLGHGAF